MSKDEFPVFEEGRKNYRQADWLEVCCALLVFAVFLSIAYIAFTKKDIYLGNPRFEQISHHTGTNALSVGIFFLGLGLLALGYAGRKRAYTPAFRLLLVVAWLGIAGWEFRSVF
jgi:hypothetical protein